MNAPQAHAVEANLTSADAQSNAERRRRAMHANINRRESPDTFAWMEEEQAAAEIEFLVAEMTNKNNREYRRSLNY